MSLKDLPLVVPSPCPAPLLRGRRSLLAAPSLPPSRFLSNGRIRLRLPTPLQIIGFPNASAIDDHLFSNPETVLGAIIFHEETVSGVLKRMDFTLQFNSTVKPQDVDTRGATAEERERTRGGHRWF